MGCADKTYIRVYEQEGRLGMKVAIYTGMMSLHQTYVADELYSICGNDFRFFEMRKNADAEKASFVDFANRPYLIKVWESNKGKEEAMRWAISADVARFSNDDIVLPYLKARLNKNLLSFETGERWLKKGIVNILSPRLLKNVTRYHFLFRNKPFYKLCASAYAANDQYKLGTFKNRCYKWGYFTKFDNEFDPNEKEDIETNTVSLMWCARFLKWKHPELVVKLARRLKDNDNNVHIDMYGTGAELNRNKRLCHELGVQDMVSFRGNVPNEEILNEMRHHDIFLFTSDRNEGWGAVLNEAMSNGCTVIASNAIGAVPFLLKDGVNGMVFQSESLDSLYDKVIYLIEHPLERNGMAINAYLTIKNVWSPKQAALNFLQLSRDLLNGHDCSIVEGPCSKALPIYHY